MKTITLERRDLDYDLAAVAQIARRLETYTARRPGAAPDRRGPDTAEYVAYLWSVQDPRD